MQAPVLQTARLTLRMPEPKDAPLLVDYHVRNRNRLAAISPLREEAFFTANGQITEIENTKKAFESGRGIRLVIFHTGEEDRLIGTISVMEIVRGAFQAAFLGYSLDGECEGRGVMTEALEAVIKHAFETLHLHRIMANVIPENERSHRLLRRLGFEVEGRAREYLFLDGRWRDHILTAKINPRWIPQCEV